MRLYAIVALALICFACDSPPYAPSGFQTGDIFEQENHLPGQQRTDKSFGKAYFILLEDNNANLISGENNVTIKGTWLTEEGRLMLYTSDQNLMVFQALHKDTLLVNGTGHRWIRAVN